MEEILSNDIVFYIVTFLSSIGGGVIGVAIGILIVSYLTKRGKK